MILWMFSKSFLVFVASRIVGGLTEGNVQMSIAIISDITTKDGRSKGIVKHFEGGLHLFVSSVLYLPILHLF